jgi:hypothetical protein
MSAPAGTRIATEHVPENAMDDPEELWMDEAQAHAVRAERRDPSNGAGRPQHPGKPSDYSAQ